MDTMRKKGIYCKIPRLLFSYTHGAFLLLSLGVSGAVGGYCKKKKKERNHRLLKVLDLLKVFSKANEVMKC